MEKLDNHLEMTIDVYLRIFCESVKYERYEVQEVHRFFASFLVVLMHDVLAYMEAATMSNEASTLMSIYTIFIE